MSGLQPDEGYGDDVRIDMISEHASPLAALGGADAGGQNVHVAALAAALAQRGHEISVFTRPGHCPKTTCCATCPPSRTGWPRAGATSRRT
jgi:hypothetical protein